MINKKLLAEELKKFNMIVEYDFFLEEDDEEIPAGDEADLEGGGEPQMGTNEPPMGGEEEMPELDMDGQPVSKEPSAGAGGEDVDLDSMPDEPEGDVELGGDDMGGEEFDDMDGDMGGEEEVELDITELVDATDEAKESSEEAKQSSDQVSGQLMKLMQNFKNLESRISNMDAIGNKIEALQKDIAQRNPTEVEKLEMRSFNSYPYNIKLSDYWNDKHPGYDVDNGEGQKFEKPKEYVLTQDDVDSEYSELSVKDTFDYEEEDV